MAIEQVYIPFPDFKLMEVIDPEEHDANNATLTQTINTMITILNSFIDGVANDTLSAMAVRMPAVEPFEAGNVESMFRALIGRLISTIDGVSGADLIGATPVEGLAGETVQSQLDSLRGILEAVGEGQEGTSLGLGIHKTSADHDLRYMTREELTAKDKTFTDLLDFKQDKTGDFTGTIHGMTKEQWLSSTGTGFGRIEVLDANPINPVVGRIWIISGEQDAVEAAKEGGSV